MLINSIFLQTQPLSNKANISIDDNGSGLSGLISDFKSLAAILVGIGLMLGFVAVVRKLVAGNENGRKALIGWIIALIIYISLWTIL